MRTVRVFIERGNDGSYGAYLIWCTQSVYYDGARKALQAREAIKQKKRTGEVLFFVGGEDEKQIIGQVNNHKGSCVCICAF